MKQEKRQKKRKRTGYSKEQRRREGNCRGSNCEDLVSPRTATREAKKRRRVQRRIWTLNRSPHGNKTAREQRGREEWKAEWIRECVESKTSWKVGRSGVAQTSRTER
jgi:hypothetical protein